MGEVRGECRTCKAPIIWGLTEPADPAKAPQRIPMDPALVDPRLRIGAQACIDDEDGVMRVIGRNKIAAEIAEADQIDERAAKSKAYATLAWRDAHFSTCPEAATHRRSR